MLLGSADDLSTVETVKQSFVCNVNKSIMESGSRIVREPRKNGKKGYIRKRTQRFDMQGALLWVQKFEYLGSIATDSSNIRFELVNRV